MPVSTSPLRLFVPLYASYATVLALSLLILQLRGIGISDKTWQTLAITVMLAGTLGGAAHLFRSGGIRLAGLSASAFVAMAAPLSLMSYALASLGAFFPLQDGAFAAIDKATGFDWLATIAAVNNWPVAVEILKAGYHYTIAAVIYALVFLNVIKRADRVAEFFWAMMLTCVAANVLSAILPAAGAYVWHAPSFEVRSAISADSGLWHMKHFEALRDGSFRMFDLASTEGLVTFPSYHTAMALLIPLAMRGYGVITALAWVFAGVVVASTVPIGGHYLIDVVIGAGLALACVRMLSGVGANMPLSGLLGHGQPGAARASSQTRQAG